MDVYNFLYDEALSAALTDAEVSVEDVGLGITLTNEEIVGYVERVLPQDWLQRQVEQVDADVGTLDDVRRYINTARSLLFLFAVALVVVAATVGFLGGRS